MSADNTVAILQSPSRSGECQEYRVVHAQAIENINYGCKPGEFNDSELLSYFGDSKVFTEEQEALVYALDLQDEIGYVEYGVSVISMNRPFPISLADRPAKEEIDRKTRITLEPWEADEYIICLKGKPIGHTVSRHDGYMIKRWLETAIKDIEDDSFAAKWSARTAAWLKTAIKEIQDEVR